MKRILINSVILSTKKNNKELFTTSFDFCRFFTSK